MARPKGGHGPLQRYRMHRVVISDEYCDCDATSEKAAGEAAIATIIKVRHVTQWRKEGTNMKTAASSKLLMCRTARGVTNG
jgi:hypothetical protein